MNKLLLLLLMGTGFTAFSQDSTKTFDYNYRHGMAFYNKGVDIVNKAEPAKDNTPMKTSSMPDKAVSEFKQALPFLENAYKINPKNESLLTALQGAYFSLGDNAKSDKYKMELQSLKKTK